MDPRSGRAPHRLVRSEDAQDAPDLGDRQHAVQIYIRPPLPDQREPTAAEEAHDKGYENCMFCRDLLRQCCANGDTDCASDFRQCIKMTPWSAKHCN
jgi:hypothetical protein